MNKSSWTYSISRTTQLLSSFYTKIIAAADNVELISIRFLPFISGNFDGDVGAQTVQNPDAVTF